jgi:hypothetical protein
VRRVTVGAVACHNAWLSSARDESRNETRRARDNQTDDDDDARESGAETRTSSRATNGRRRQREAASSSSSPKRLGARIVAGARVAGARTHATSIDGTGGDNNYSTVASRHACADSGEYIYV